MGRKLTAILVGGVLSAASCASGGGSSEAGPHTAIAIEVGGPVSERDVDRVVEMIADGLLPPGSRAEVLVVDGRNADVMDWLELPGTTATGHLDTNARNATARRGEVEELVEPLRQAIATAIDGGPSLDTGRDHLGALDRIAERDPDHVVVVFSSGGVHRVADDEDFLETIPTGPEALGFAPETRIELWNVGRVPVRDDEVAPRELTRALVRYWTSICELHGPRCEVVR